LKKTFYEFLIGKKSSVTYFRIFGGKCYVLQKRSKSSKFTPKVYEGFLLGYDSNSHTYHVFNKDFGYIEITCDVVFDVTNCSQEEKDDIDIVRPQDPSEQPEGHSPSDTTPPTQGLDQAHEENQDQHADEDEHHNQVQE
jgi:hypothetical protein